MLRALLLWYRKKRYRPGRTLSRFIAIDIRQDVEIIDASGIEDGTILARTRTWSLLYAARGLVPKPDFGDVRTIPIKDLWKWSGESWGGPMPESTDGA
jgi:hypothetical protein